MADYKAPVPARTIPHPIPEGIDGVAKMLEQCRTQEERALIALTGYCGLRISEARSVLLADLDMHEMCLTVRGKGDKTRVIPISQLALVQLLPRIAEVGRGACLVGFCDSGARKAISRIARSAGLRRHVASHDLRATFATAALDSSGDIRAVQELLGHGSVTTTEIYTLVKKSKLREVANLGVE